MNLFRLSLVVFCVFLFAVSLDSVGLAEPKVQILSPKDGSRITQDQKSIFVSGKVAREAGRSERVDIFLVIDISGSTALYAGADLGEADQPPETSGFPMPQISIGGMSLGRPPLRNPRNSILAAEVAAARRLLLQLNRDTTRVGVLTFSENARLLQPLTQDFDQVRRILAEVLRAGPYGGTNMVEGIRMGITELMGLGTSEKRTDAIKVQFLLTDGFPSLPIGGGKRMAPEDVDLNDQRGATGRQSGYQGSCICSRRRSSFLSARGDGDRQRKRRHLYAGDASGGRAGGARKYLRRWC